MKQLQNKPSEPEPVPTEPAPPAVAEVPVAEQNRLRQEGRQQMETEMNDRLKQQNDQVGCTNFLIFEIDKLKNIPDAGSASKERYFGT